MIKPHGGKLIKRIIGKDRISRSRLEALPVITASDDIILDAEKIAIGAYSPLRGFMNREDFVSVVEKMRLASGDVWTIPIFLPVSGKDLKGLRIGGDALICDSNKKGIAIIRISDIYSYPKSKWVKSVYGTSSSRHPGVRKAFDIEGKIAAGDIWLIGKSDFAFEKFNLTPEETRGIIKKKGWKTVAGFQTRNVPHRAHEYLQKLALSITDGILIHPIIGWKKEGDFRPELVIDAYKTLIDRYFPKDKVIFAGLATAMRYAGPREAVFHAIIRKNYGCTHFIVGRDHAGVGDFYDKYEAHRIFDIIPDIGVTPLLFRGPYYCIKCAEVVSDKICPHHENYHRHISGTYIRKLISENKTIPAYLMRKEVVDVVMRCKKTQKDWYL